MKGGVDMENGGRILVPLDGSRCSENIIPKVEELAVEKNKGICLLRVVSAHPFPGADKTEAEVKVVREAEEYLEGLKERFKAKGLDADTHVRYGNEVEEILDHAAGKDIDMIAMSTHGYRGIKHLVFRSVVEKVLRHTSKPIFLIRCTGSA
jgi:nucleotide-binding universal stress UspA family protein